MWKILLSATVPMPLFPLGSCFRGRTTSISSQSLACHYFLEGCGGRWLVARACEPTYCSGCRKRRPLSPPLFASALDYLLGARKASGWQRVDSPVCKLTVKAFLGAHQLWGQKPPRPFSSSPLPGPPLPLHHFLPQWEWQWAWERTDTSFIS